MARTRQKTPALSNATAGHRRWVASLLAGLVVLGGCIHHHEKPAKPVCYPSGPCAGYYPTCWRRWSEECPACPVDLGAEPGEAGAETIPVPPAEGQGPGEEASSARSNEMDRPASEDAPDGNGSKTNGAAPDEPAEDEDSRREGSKTKTPLVRNDRTASPRTTAKPQITGKTGRTGKPGATAGAPNAPSKASGDTAKRSGPQVSRGIGPIDGLTTKGKTIDRKLPAKPHEDTKWSSSNVARASRTDHREPRKSRPDQTGCDAFPPQPRKLFSRFDRQRREGPTPTDKSTVNEPVARLGAIPRRESAATSATTNSPSSTIAPQSDRRPDESKATADETPSPAVQHGVPQPTASTATFKPADRPRVDAPGPRRAAPRKNDAEANAMTAGKLETAVQARSGKGQQVKPTVTAAQPARSKPIVSGGDLRRRAPAATNGKAVEKAGPKSPAARFGIPGRDDSAARLKPVEPSKPAQGAIHAEDNKPREPAPSVKAPGKIETPALSADQRKPTPPVVGAGDKAPYPEAIGNVSYKSATPAVRFGGQGPDAATTKAIADAKSKSAPPVVQRDGRPRDAAATVNLSDQAATPVARFGGLGPDATKGKAIATPKAKSAPPVVQRKSQPHDEAATVMSDQAATPTVRLGESVPDAATPKAIATPKSKSAAPVVRREAQPRDEAATVMLSDKATTQVAQSGTPGPVAAKAKVITTAKPKSGLPVVHREGQRSGHAAAVSDQVQVIATTMRPGGQRQDGAPEMVLVTDRSKAEKPASRLDAPKRSKPAANAATAAPSTHAGKHASTGDDLGPRQDAEELDSAKPASAWDTLKSKAGKLFTPRLAQ